jgi:ATP-dependent helicase/DNAse subunit B
MTSKSSNESSGALTQEELGNLSQTSALKLPSNQFSMTVDGKEFHLGYSRISKFLDCPYQYKRSYEDGIRKPSGTPMRRGTAYHNTLEGLLNYKINTEGELYPLAKAEKFALKNAKKEDLTEAESIKVVEAVRFYYKELYPFHNPVSVEEPFDFIKGGIRFTGRIDLLDQSTPGLVEVIDHKFSYDTWADARAQYGIQPMVYQWAWEEELKHKYPDLKYGGFAYNIIRLFPTPVIQTIRIKTVPKDKSEWWAKQIQQIAECMVHGFYYANAGANTCKWCDHKTDCKPCVYSIKVTKTGDIDSTETED